MAKRRQFTAAFKAQVVPELLSGSKSVAEAAREHRVKPEIISRWRRQNGYAERLMRTIKEEEVHLSEYVDYHDALNQLGRFLDDVYMHKRIHSALGYLTPAEVESQWLDQQLVHETTPFS